MVILNGGTDLGISTVQTGAAYGNASIGSRFGKGRIDGVYVADGCPFPCTAQSFNFNGGSTIYVDTNNYTKPYPYRPPKLPLKDQLNVAVLYPQANFSTRINGTTYPVWWSDYLVFHTKTNPALSGGLATTPFGVDLNASTNYARISADRRTADPAAFHRPNDFRTGSSLGNVLNGGLDDGNSDGSQGFCHMFKFTDKAGAIRVGEICWRRFNSRAEHPSTSTTRPRTPIPSRRWSSAPRRAMSRPTRRIRWSSSSLADSDSQDRGATTHTSTEGRR